MQRNYTSQSIVVLGDINADLTMRLPFYPTEGDDSTALEVAWGSGGTGVNAATAFARLGGRARLLGCVGSDPAAEVGLRAARRAGVDCAAVQIDPRTATGLCTAMISPGGQRTFFSFRGANVAFNLAAEDTIWLEDAGLLYVSAYVLLEGSQRAAALQAIAVAVRSAVPIAMDLGVPPARACRDLILDLLPQLWLLCMNEDEVRLIMPDCDHQAALDGLLAGGAAHVALKRGPRGCVVATASERLALPPPTVNVVDTNGCGDAFAAAYAWALLHRENLLHAATLANLLGALTATRPGSAEALPGRTELLGRLDPRLHDLVTRDE